MKEIVRLIETDPGYIGVDDRGFIETDNGFLESYETPSGGENEVIEGDRIL